MTFFFKTCLICLYPLLLDTTGDVNWFKIKNSKYQLCLTLRTFHFFGTVITKLTLATCLPNASRQLWQFTGNKKLRLKYNNKCLTFDGHLKLTLRPCSFVNLPQQWSCSQRRLLLGRALQYVVPYPYSGMPFGFMILMTRSCSSKNKACQWTQSTTNLPVCSSSKGKSVLARYTLFKSIFISWSSCNVSRETNSTSFYLLRLNVYSSAQAGLSILFSTNRKHWKDLFVNLAPSENDATNCLP